MEISELSGLSFFTVSKYHYISDTVCDFRSSPRPHFCMGMVLGGQGIFEFEGKSVKVEKGDVIFVPSGSCYRSLWSGSPDVTYISFHFFFLASTLFSSHRSLSIQKVSPLYENEFSDDFTEAFRSFETDTSGMFASLGCFYRIMSKIMPRLVFKEHYKPDERMEKASSYLEEHYSEKISVDSLASLCHMSSSHFHSCFKQSFGMTPIEYKNRVCIRYAILLLVRGNMSIEEISESLGFDSSTYFRRVFKKVTGCNPSEYLKKHIGI